MTTEAIVSITALAVIVFGIVWILRIGRRDAEKIFDEDYDNLHYFIDHCDVNEKNEETISRELYRLSMMKGADVEKLQTLNTDFRRNFIVPKLGDIVADHENY